MSKYEPGQVWSYRTRPGEEASRLTVLKVEPHGTAGEPAIHVRLDDVKLANPRVEGGVSREISHLPFSEEAIDRSVTELLESDVPLPDNLEGYETWKREADEGNAGIFTLPVAEVVSVVEQAMDQQG